MSANQGICEPHAAFGNKGNLPIVHWTDCAMCAIEDEADRQAEAAEALAWSNRYERYPDNHDERGE